MYLVCINETYRYDARMMLISMIICAYIHCAVHIPRIYVLSCMCPWCLCLWYMCLWFTIYDTCGYDAYSMMIHHMSYESKGGHHSQLCLHSSVVRVSVQYDAINWSFPQIFHTLAFTQLCRHKLGAVPTWLGRDASKAVVGHKTHHRPIMLHLSIAQCSLFIVSLHNQLPVAEMEQEFRICKASSVPDLRDDARMMHGWCTDDARTMHGWCTDDARMMHKLCTDDARMMHRWCTDDARMMHGWCTDDARMMHGWCTDDAQMMHGWWTDDARMMQISTILDTDAYIYDAANFVTNDRTDGQGDSRSWIGWINHNF